MEIEVSFGFYTIRLAGLCSAISRDSSAVCLYGSVVYWVCPAVNWFYSALLYNNPQRNHFIGLSSYGCYLFHQNMDHLKYFATTIVLACLLLSCEKNNDLADADVFLIEFSNGNRISENEIIAYDSSTHLIYLKHDITFPLSDFSVFVDTTEIYSGTMHMCIMSSPPLSDISISDCSEFGPNILAIHTKKSVTALNHPAIINAFKNSNRLRNGISISIDNIEVTTFASHSAVNFTVTIKNNDNFGYYIPDPAKMGQLNFNYYTGGLHFMNNATKVSSFLRWTTSSPNWSDVTLGDFSVLKAGASVTFSISSSDYYKIEKGNYSVWYNFCGLQFNASEFNLNQKEGKMWVGQVLAMVDSLVVN